MTVEPYIYYIFKKKKHNVAAFSELSFAIRRQGMLPRG